MKSKKELLDGIVSKLRSGKRIITTGIDSDFDLNLFSSEIEDIVRGALNKFSSEVVDRASRTAGYVKEEYNKLKAEYEKILDYAKLTNSYQII